MATVTFLIGLCGSGKTYLSDAMRHQTGAEVFESLVGAQTVPALVESLRSGRDCIVEEITFCRQDARERITEFLLYACPGVRMNWICFENDLESANWNVRHRTNKGSAGRHMEINARVSQVYSYPPGAIPRAITRVAPIT